MWVDGGSFGVLVVHGATGCRSGGDLGSGRGDCGGVMEVVLGGLVVLVVRVSVVVVIWVVVGVTVVV